MENSAAGVPPHQLVEALQLMVKAMVLLDQVETDVEIAAHLDFAISRLRDVLPTGGDEQAI